MRATGGTGVWTTDAAAMSERSSSRSAYADLVSALVDARSDLATERFDAEIESAVASGQLDEQRARTLRWWQRESVRGVRDHLASVLPAVMEKLEQDHVGAPAHATPESPSHADNFKDRPTSAHENGSTRNVSATAPAQRPRALSMHQRRRVLVASLVAATHPAATDDEGEEGRR